MLIKKDGKYSLQIYKKQDNFLERSKYNYFFDGGAYFKVEKKNFYIKNFLIKKFFHQFFKRLS